MTATKLAEALKVAGIERRDVEIDIANAKYLNSGGTIEGLQARLNIAAARMSGMGQGMSALQGQRTIAQPRQPVEDGGATEKLPQGPIKNAPSSSSDRGGEGHVKFAGNGPTMSALPVREPIRSITQRGLASIISIQPVISRGLLEMKKTADGRAWGRVGWHELDGMDRDGAIARIVKQKVNPPKNKFAELREFLTNKQFEEICNVAEKQNDLSI